MAAVVGGEGVEDNAEGEGALQPVADMAALGGADELVAEDEHGDDEPALEEAHAELERDVERVGRGHRREAVQEDDRRQAQAKGLSGGACTCDVQAG